MAFSVKPMIFGRERNTRCDQKVRIIAQSCGNFRFLPKNCTTRTTVHLFPTVMQIFSNIRPFFTILWFVDWGHPGGSLRWGYSAFFKTENWQSQLKKVTDCALSVVKVKCIQRWILWRSKKFIKFCYSFGKTATETHKMLKHAFGGQNNGSGCLLQ